MTTDMRRNMRILGTGGSGGGVYKNIKVNGEAQFNSDVDCIQLSCNGTAKAYGHLKSKSCTINGTLDIEGSFDIETAKINGKLEIEGNLRAQEVRSFGETNVKGNVSGEFVNLEGGFHIQGHCEAERLRMKGIFQIGGLVNAGDVELLLHSRCGVKEIGGEHIVVRRAEGHLVKRLIGSMFLPADFYEGTLSVESIEGDSIYVEHTAAQVIRGARIVIGPGCRVGRVEYTETFENELGSEVSENTKL